MLSMRGGYLATESSRDTSCRVGSLNNSGITVKECVGHRRLKSQSANISWGMRGLKVVDGSWIKVSFDPWQRSLFPYKAKTKEISASREMFSVSSIVFPLFLFKGKKYRGVFDK